MVLVGNYYIRHIRSVGQLVLNVNAVNSVLLKEIEFRDYKTVTAFASYYAAPLYNIDLALHAGRYLAKDRGYTLEARRTFDGDFFSIGGFFAN